MRTSLARYSRTNLWLYHISYLFVSPLENSPVCIRNRSSEKKESLMSCLCLFVLESAHLLVGSAIGECTIYEHVTHYGLEKPTVLPHSHEYGSVLCAHVMKLTPSENALSAKNPVSLPSGTSLFGYSQSSVGGAHFRDSGEFQFQATDNSEPREKHDFCETRDTLNVAEPSSTAAGHTPEKDEDNGELMPVVILIGTFDNYVLTYRVRQKRRKSNRSRNHEQNSPHTAAGAGAGGVSEQKFEHTQSRHRHISQPPLRRIRSSPTISHRGRPRSKSASTTTSVGVGIEGASQTSVGSDQQSQTPLLRTPEFQSSESPSPSFGSQPLSTSELVGESGPRHRSAAAAMRSQTPQMRATYASVSTAASGSGGKFSLGQSAISALQSQQQQQPAASSSARGGLKHVDSTSSLFAMPDDQSSVLSGK